MQALVQTNGQVKFGPWAVRADSGTPGVLERKEAVWANANQHRAGRWSAQPGTFALERHGVDEICVILRGKGSVTSEDGDTQSFEAGSTVVLPDGWRGTWTTEETIEKVFIMVAAPHDKATRNPGKD
ncbi:cupin domain-containing protein [Arthrobacter sp. 18067]|uniref:cupin domain-containing protein n=1 Tax=Arthrobacter sp. 18067 TaxID=2681413 RepID=UPI0013582FDE|nr:cupin domain-containing protein [Arthrobacter sp. 18067]